MKTDAIPQAENKAAETHYPFVAQDVRANDPIKAVITIEEEEHHLQVWKISPFGIELVATKGFLTAQNQRHKLAITIGDESTVLQGLLFYQYVHGGNTILCVRFVNDADPFDGSDRRKHSRWNCSSQFYPTGIANSPAKFNDFIYFKIKDISFGGMKIICSLRNKFLFPNMTLNSIINFPMVSQINLKLKIANVNVITEDGKEVISLGVTYDTVDKKLLEIISNYLLQFSTVASFQDLKNQGFMTRNLSSAIDFNYVKTHQDFEDCLKLRLLANQAAQKVPGEAKVEDMTDEFDSRSRIVIGRHQGNVVCTVRLAFHELDDKMEIEKYVILPESFPRRDQTVEIMRLCTHPDYRGADMLMSLFKHLAIVVVQSQRKYIVTSCVERLKPLYKKIGFKETGISYESALFKGFPDEIMVANVETLLLGKDINPLVWNLVWGDLYHYFEGYDMVDYTPMEKLRIKALRKLNPVAKLIAKFKNRKNI